MKTKRGEKTQVSVIQMGIPDGILSLDESSSTNRFRDGEEEASIKPETCLGRNQCEGK